MVRPAEDREGMNTLLLKIWDEKNDQTFAGEILGKPSYTELIMPAYALRIRPLKEQPLHITHTDAELVLSSGETIKVKVVGSSTHTSPIPEARKSGAWTVWDRSIFLDPTGLTTAQLAQAWIFVQRHAAHH
jgi:hypothetical protein